MEKSNLVENSRDSMNLENIDSELMQFEYVKSNKSKVFDPFTLLAIKGMRVHLIILDGLGIGELPDAKIYGDEGSNTLNSISKSKYFNTPNLIKLGLFNIDENNKEFATDRPYASFARVAEMSKGKDTTTGHFELMGLVLKEPFPVYPDGFPDDIISQFESATNKKVLCNKPYSGTAVINDYGEKHLQTKDLIVYTSADSVFQIAAHEDIIPVPRLYEYCKIARRILTGKHNVARVIARPFIGKPGDFTRTANRKDFSIAPPSKTLLDILELDGFDTIGIGKIGDIFSSQGLTKEIHTKNNNEGMSIAYSYLDKDVEGLVFTNLVDFDMLYGHRNDVDGFAKALSEMDSWLGKFINNMKDNDILIITADHGCDPETPSTDHSREYVPMLMYGYRIRKNVNLGTLKTFGDIGATIAEIFNCNYGLNGESFYKKVKEHIPHI